MFTGNAMAVRTKILFLPFFSFLLSSGLEASSLSDTEITEPKTRHAIKTKWNSMAEIVPSHEDQSPMITKIIVGPRPKTVYGLDMRAYLPLNQCITVENIWGEPSEIILTKPIPVNDNEVSYIESTPYSVVEPLTTSELSENGKIKAAFLFFFAEKFGGPSEQGVTARLWDQGEFKKAIQDKHNNELTLFLTLSVDENINFLITSSFQAPDWYQQEEKKQSRKNKKQNARRHTFDQFDLESSRRYFCVVMPTKPISKSVSSPRF